MMSVLMPPKVEQVPKLLRVRCYEIDGVPAMDDGCVRECVKSSQI